MTCDERAAGRRGHDRPFHYTTTTSCSATSPGSTDAAVFKQRQRRPEQAEYLLGEFGQVNRETRPGAVFHCVRVPRTKAQATTCELPSSQSYAYHNGHDPLRGCAYHDRLRGPALRRPGNLPQARCQIRSPVGEEMRASALTHDGPMRNQEKTMKFSPGRMIML